MEYALDLGELLDDGHAVVVSLPFVDDDGHIQLLRQGHLHGESLFLDLPGDVLVVIVQTDLANGTDFGIKFT